MDDNKLVRPSHTGHAMPRNDRPKLGEWYWVNCAEDGEKPRERLLCVTHLASNHVEFRENDRHGGTSGFLVRYRDLASSVRPEPKWQEIINQRITEKQRELNAKVREICDAVTNAGLIQDPEAAPTLLPSTTRQDPEAHKKALVRLKDKDMPALKKQVENITADIAALHRDLILPQRAEMDRMGKAMDGVDKRLFALELYAGLFQKCKHIRKGTPAPRDTPITVRQMLRFMDEECLIDYDGGGMDYQKLEDFDDWVAQDENLNRLAPEPRCVVAMRVRRHMKDYGVCHSLADALAQMHDHECNKKTYLLLRNGTQVFRLWADIEFEPRLLPLREEFLKPFRKRSWRPTKDDPSHEDESNVTPDDYEYDKHVEQRLDDIYKYNRIMFLVQGLLDRSEVFHPHPPINLADQQHVEQWFKPVFDEELGLPSANPPKWEAYRDAKNKLLKLGDFVWSDYYDESDIECGRFTDWREKVREGRQRPESILKVDRISRDRSKVRVSWPWGERLSWWRNRWDYKPGDVVDRERHAWLPMHEVFNVSAYVPGEFKQFLCDAYLKGAYLKWAPPLLSAEKWHAQRRSSDKQSTK